MDSVLIVLEFDENGNTRFLRSYISQNQFYFLDEDVRRKIVHLGCAKPLDVEGTLIV